MSLFKAKPLILFYLDTPFIPKMLFHVTFQKTLKVNRNSAHNENISSRGFIIQSTFKFTPCFEIIFNMDALSIRFLRNGFFFRNIVRVLCSVYVYCCHCCVILRRNVMLFTWSLRKHYLILEYVNNFAGYCENIG